LGEVASRLQPHLARLVDTETLKPIGERVSALVALGAPEPMARRVADLILLAALSDVTIVADVARKAPDIAAKAYFAAGARFGLGGFKRIAENLRGGNHWQRMASYAVIEELHQCQRDLAIRVLKAGGLEKWIKANEEAVKRLDALIGDVKGAEPVELAALALILRGLRAALE
jgi:glutamate dehydrogenase